MMFIFKNWIGSPLSFGLAFALALVGVVGSGLTGLYFYDVVRSIFWVGREEHHDH